MGEMCSNYFFNSKSLEDKKEESFLKVIYSNEKSIF